MKSICIYILLFFLYSFCGWLLEVICKLVDQHKFINRGFLIGPYCPVYGFGALSITFLLQKYVNDIITLFIMTMIVCSILEYLTSYYLEKIFKTRWWDYSNYRFNINGRICLETMVPFGLFGLFIMYISNPLFLSWINKMPISIIYFLSFFLTTILIIDIIFSYRIISSFKNISFKAHTDSTEKITAYVKKEIIKRNQYNQKRLLEAFPKLKVFYFKKDKKK